MIAQTVAELLADHVRPRAALPDRHRGDGDDDFEFFESGLWFSY